MVCAIRDHHDRAVFAEVLDTLRERRPELYERDAPYYLDWRIGDALATGDLAPLPELGAALAATAARIWTPSTSRWIGWPTMVSLRSLRG
jgi:hypothetical protein